MPFAARCVPSLIFLPETVCEDIFGRGREMTSRHKEHHRIWSIGWLRAAVLGANDGIISTASLILGVAAAHAVHADILVAGVAGLVAGAMSMATGEYVSVSSQADTEQAALSQERAEIHSDFEGERRELTAIYMRRGLDHSLAEKVAEQLMTHDAIGAHARDELGISEMNTTRPLQAAITSACTFSAGAALPLAVAAIVPDAWLVLLVAAFSLAALAFLGGLAARIGGAPIIPGVIRVFLWSALAMLFTSTAGILFGTAR